MKTSEMIWGGLIATAIFIELNPKARKKVRQFTGLSNKPTRKRKVGLRDKAKDLSLTQIKQFKKALMYEYYLKDLGWRDDFMVMFEHDDKLYEKAEQYFINNEGDKLIKLLDNLDKGWWITAYEDDFNSRQERQEYLGLNF